MTAAPPEILVHLPDAVSWWPLAFGWWLLLAVLVITVLAIWIWSRKIRQRRRPIKAALLQHQLLKQQYVDSQNTHQLASGLSKLLRQSAMSYFGREKVAGLYGHEWRVFLDDKVTESLFNNESGIALTEEIYQQAITTDSADEWLSMVERWIRQAGKLDKC